MGWYKGDGVGNRAHWWVSVGLYRFMFLYAGWVRWFSLQGCGKHGKKIEMWDFAFPNLRKEKVACKEWNVTAVVRFFSVLGGGFWTRQLSLKQRETHSSVSFHSHYHLTMLPIYSRALFPLPHYSARESLGPLHQRHARSHTPIPYRGQLPLFHHRRVFAHGNVMTVLASSGCSIV